MMKIAIAAGLMLSPAMLLAQSDQMGAGMGTQADAAPKTGSMSGTTSHRAHTSTTMHRGKTHHTTRGASPSNDTMTTPNSSNSKSSTLNSMPH